MKNETFNQLKKLLTESKQDTNDIPLDSGMAENAKWYQGQKPRCWEYFGNCKNTVDVDRMWTATEMSNFLSECELYDINNALPVIQDGDRILPKRLTNWLAKNESKLNELGEIVCGIHTKQEIGFIYITDHDIHYFFDIHW